ncbi:DUF2341 domain-containing protein [Patescibacteria group bacterium]
MNAVGLFLEESEEKDYLGLFSFILLSYILVPFQAYASVKGFLEKDEGGWFRTPKTGRVTDIFRRGSFYRWITRILPGWQPGKGSALAASIARYQSAPGFAAQPAFVKSLDLKPDTYNLQPGRSPYLALATAHNRFKSFRIPQRRWRGFVAMVLLLLTLSSSTLLRFMPTVSQGKIPPVFAEGKMGIKAGEEEGEISQPEGKEVPRLTLTDNRIEGELPSYLSSEAGLLSPGEGGIGLSVFSPQTSPEKFYLEVGGEKTDGGEQKTDKEDGGQKTKLLEKEAGEEGKSAENKAGSNGGVIARLKEYLRLPILAQSGENEDQLGLFEPEIIMRDGAKYAPYRINKLEDRYEVETRSARGIQKIVLERDSQTIKIYEKEIGESREQGMGEEDREGEIEEEFILMATSMPIFEYELKRGGDCRVEDHCTPEGWEEYLPLVPGELTAQEYSDHVIIRQEMRLLSRSPSFEVPGVIELKIGYSEAEGVINKFNFYLGDSPNVNRLRWETRIVQNANLKNQNDKIKINEETENNLTDLREPGQNSQINELFLGCFPNPPVVAQKHEEVEIGWADFVKDQKSKIKNQNDKSKSQNEIGQDPSDLLRVQQTEEESANINTVFFYPEGRQGALEIDPTLSLSTPANQVQIDVSDRYRAIMTTNDTTDYLIFYDRDQDDSSPDATQEFIGPYINEGDTEYQLRYDNARTTTILESTPTRVRVKVEGCLDTTGGGACLDDGSDDIAVVEEYTFTPEGMFVSNTTDFQTSGVALDSTGNEDGYNWLMVESDLVDVAYGEDGFHQGDDTFSFTAGMAKREGPGPFASAPIAQGDWDNGSTDNLSYSRGNAISSNFREVFDQIQGSIVLWVTPEWDGDDGLKHTLFSANDAEINTLYKGTDDKLYWTQGWGNGVSVDISSWEAGTTYCVVARWDRNNTLDGTNYYSLSIDDSHTFARTAISGSPSIGVSSYVGWNHVGGNPANAIIEGLTIYRRPLYDGTYGIDIGNGDEILKIYDSDESGDGSSPQDPILVTGSWDVVFALPTNASTGALSTGTGEAWTHPHASNLLPGNSNTGGFMLGGKFGNDGWNLEGTPQRDTGTADADSTTTTVEDDGQGWTVDAEIGYQVCMTSGPANNECSYITDNDADTLTVSPAFSTDPDTDGTSTFTIWAVKSLASGDKIYAGGYQVTSDAANEGIYDEIAVSSGDDFVVRAVAHSDGTSVPKILITGADDGEITSLAGTTSSTRTDPDVLVFTFEADATENIKVKLINTDATASDVTYWHQVEVLANKISNPSLETWQGTSPDIPDDWLNSNAEADDLSQESTEIHSGGSSLKVDANEWREGIKFLQSPLPTAGKFYCMGSWGKVTTGTGDIHLDFNAASMNHQAVADNNYLQHTFTNSSWAHLSFVARARTMSGTRHIYLDGESESGGNTVYFDDFYWYLLTDVSLTVTPASEANSTETSGLRIDGDDTATQTISELTTSSGTINFQYRPRLSAADAVKFVDDAGDNAYIAEFYGDSDDYIRLYWSAVNTMTLAYSMGGATASGNWDATDSISAGTTYNLVLTYTGSGSMILDVDGGTDEITLASIPAAFGSAPATAYWGSSQAGDQQGGATFAEIVYSYYGDGSTETSITGDSSFEDTNLYIGFPSDDRDSYQSSLLGVTHWFDETGGTDDWYLDFNNSASSRDRLYTRERGTTPLGSHSAGWFFLLDSQANLDTEAERGSFINDLTNPDFLAYNTGELWDDKTSQEYLFQSSFEGADTDLCGGGDGWTSGSCESGNTAVGNESSVVYDGDYAAKFTSGGTNDEAYTWKELSSTYDSLYTRFYFYLDYEDLGSEENINILNMNNNSVWEGTYLNIQQRSGGDLEMFVYDSAYSLTWGGSASYLQLDTWYEIEMRVYRHATAGTIDVWLDGVNVISATGKDTGASGYNQVEVGLNSSASNTNQVFIDNVIIAENYIGPAGFNEDQGTYTIEASTTSETSGASGWWDKDWSKRRKIIFDNLDQSSNLTDFPVLVKLDSTRIDYANTQSAGQDLRFVDADGYTLLKHEIEEFDESGSDWVWVRVPQIDASSSADHIWMYYGNASAAAPPSTWAEETWDENFAMVQHLEETTTGATDFKDSTDNNNDSNAVTIDGDGSDADAEGKVAGAVQFDGSDDYIAIAHDTSYKPTDLITIEAWLKADDLDEHTTATYSDALEMRLWIAKSSESNEAHFYITYETDEYHNIGGNSGLSAGVWYYVVGFFDGDDQKIFVDGVEQDDVDAVTSDTIQTGTNDLRIGRAGNSEWTDGFLDEIRISTTNRSNDWIAAQYDSMSDNLNAFGSEESYDSYAPDANQTAISTASVSIDGGTYARHAPSFKIRKWRSPDLPAAVTLEGETLFGNDLPTETGAFSSYNASLKPFSEAWYEDDGSSTQIADGGDTGSSDEFLGDASDTYTLTGLTTTDTLYLGSDDQFTGVNYLLSTAGIDASAAIDWEYWDGDSWEDLVGDGAETNGSDTLTTSNGSFYFDLPSDWQNYSLTTTELGGSDVSERKLYWVRGTAGVAYDTAPVISQAWTDILLFQYLGDISADNSTFTITSEAIRLSSGSIQIDVPNRYRAIMETGDTEDYLLFYDRAENDSSPDKVLEVRSPSVYYDDSTMYRLRWDASRRTTILESNSLRVRVRIEGCYDTTGGGACLEDDGSDDVIGVVEEYTFTTEGIFLYQMVDFKDGVSLTDDYWYNFRFDYDIGNNGWHASTIYYGDGATESTSSSSGVPTSSPDHYFVLQGTGSYQDIALGTQRLDGDKLLSNSANASVWHTVSDPDGLTFYDIPTQTITGQGSAVYFLQFHAQADLDTKVKREALFNDLTNPDILDFTTGSEWQDLSGTSSQSAANGTAPASASPGLYFDGDGDWVEISNTSMFDATEAYTIETWIYPEGYDEYDYSAIFSKEGYVDFSLDNDGLTDGICLYNADESDTAYSASNVITLNQWQHVAVVHDGNSDFTFYVNGVDVTGGDSTCTESNANVASYIGAVNDEGGEEFIGSIDEVRLWDDERTQAELQQNMYVQVSSSASNLVSNWRLNENTGSTVHDETTNNHDGTITNALWQTGYVPDGYNEAEGIYGVDASGSHVELDIDGGSNVSNTLAGAESAGDTSIVLTSSDDFPDGGGVTTSYAYINGDKFSFNDNDTATETLSGIPATGENSIIAHASGSVVAMSNRHQPMVKIRQYRENTRPSQVTMEGVGLVEGTDYNVDYKPITDAHFADELVWFSTFESSAATTSPDVGTGDSVNGVEFVAAKYGNGAQLVDNNDYIRFDVTTGDNANNFNKAKGALELWFQPTWDHDDGVLHTIFTNYTDATNHFRLLKTVPGTLAFTINDGNASSLTITSGNYSWEAGDWVHLRVEWDDTAALGTQQRLFLNGVEPTHTDPATDYDSSGLTLHQYFYLGANNTSEPDAIYDEFRMYSGAQTEPDDLAAGGDTADSDEYLFDEDNDYTLDFDTVDASGRGEYAYFGSETMVSGFNIDLETNGATAGTLNLDWEYWNGSAWASLESISGFTDGTSHLTQDGAVYWDENPTNWRPYSMNGSTDLYYIRTSLNNSSSEYSTDPIENFIKTDVLILQYLSDVTSADQTLIVIPEQLWFMFVILPAGLWYSNKKKRKSRRKKEE